MEKDPSIQTLHALPVQFTTHVSKLDHLTMYYLEVPAEIVQQLGGFKCGRLLCTVNHNLTFQCGLMALGAGCAYISISTKRMKELHVKQGDKVTVALEKDDSKCGTPMPEELEELLKQDEEGKNRFDLIKPGIQRYVLQYVAAVKSSQLRIERAILLIENLKSLTPGKETFREMLGKK